VPPMAFFVTWMFAVITGGCGSAGGQPTGMGGQGGGGTGGQSAVAGSTGSGGGGRGMGFDDGTLFADASPVVTGSSGSLGSNTDAGGPPSDTGGGGPPGDGNTATCTLGSLGLTAVFTQRGTDVTVVITATRCPPGAHRIEIHEGFACDDPTNGPVWDGMRGGGIGGPMSILTCAADQSAMLTYTRPGTNPATSWTVGDHNVITDVTRHPIKVDAMCGTFF
jgi:hypothetical protein